MSIYLRQHYKPQGGHQQNIHNTWSNRIDSNALRRQLLRQRAREGRDRALGAGVVDQFRIPHVCCHRAGIDDAAPALHVRDSELGHGEHADDVGLEGLLHNVQVNRRDVLAYLLHRGVVDEDAQLAEYLHIGVDYLLAVGADGDVRSA